MEGIIYTSTYHAINLIFKGVLGIKVKIMLPWDPNGKIGPKKPLPDNVSIVEPKDEDEITGPKSESKTPKPEIPQMPAQPGGPPPMQQLPPQVPQGVPQMGGQQPVIM